jgi:hypothetical protein
MTYKVFRLDNPHRDYRWGATSDYTNLRYYIASRMAKFVDARTGRTEFCFYGKTPFEALERLKKHQRKIKP